MVTGDVRNDGVLIFSRSDNVTFGGAISGTGVFVKNCSGTVALTAANTYSGGTQVNAGTLRGTTTSLQGTIVNNAALVFDQSFDGTFNGTLFGTGTMLKTGAGRVQLTGDHRRAGIDHGRGGNARPEQFDGWVGDDWQGRHVRCERPDRRPPDYRRRPRHRAEPRRWICPASLASLAACTSIPAEPTSSPSIPRAAQRHAGHEWHGDHRRRRGARERGGRNVSARADGPGA